MKSTGVIRRIDELGRIVIPKEIRKNLNIREGENLEIVVNDNNITLIKHSPLVNIDNVVKKIVDNLNDVISDTIFVTDREKIIATNKSEYLNISISSFLSYIDNRETYISKELEFFEIATEKIRGYFTIVPIISFSDCLGLIIIVNDLGIRKENQLLAKLVSKIISNKIDIS